MSFLVTPRHFSRRAELYHQLGQMTAAGIGLLQSLETLRRSPPARSFFAPLTQTIDLITRGSTFTEAFGSTGRWLPDFDRGLLGAAEHSGRLADCFRTLSQYYDNRAQLAREILSGLAYPVFLFHFAVFIGPFPELFLTGNVAAYLAKVLILLLPIYVLVIVGVVACQGPRGENWRAFLEGVFRRIPLLGHALHCLALARLAAALEALISAGVSILEAWEIAAAACGSMALRRTVLAWKPRVLAGETPAEMVRSHSLFPDLFASLYHTGEISGQLDDTLKRIHTMYFEEGARKLRALAKWIPKFIYLAVALFIAYRIISFYAGYFSQIGDAMK